MPEINMPEIVAREIDYPIAVGWDMGVVVFLDMPVGYNLAPLPKTWYEEEVDTESTRTLRFAKRSDHTGLLVKIDKAGFYKPFKRFP